MAGRSGDPDRNVPMAMELADKALKRAGHKGRPRTDVPVRRTFVCDDEGISDGPPPLVRQLRGGRSGEVRLKLYLSMLMLASSHPHDTDLPARAWAELLALPDPEGRGARRVRSAISWLSHNRFVSLDQRVGSPTRVVLLDERGNGLPYQVPGVVKDRYLKIPGEFWTNGWCMELSGTAVALLLILMHVEPIREPGQPFWISPSRARDSYTLSADSWTKGTAELAKQDLIEVSRIRVGEDFDWRRYRNQYRINRRQLREFRPGVQGLEKHKPTVPRNVVPIR